KHCCTCFVVFFFSSRRRHTRSKRDWSSDVCSSDLQTRTGFSTLAVCAVANPVRVCGGLQEAIAAADPEGSYEQSAWFRSEVEEKIGRASCREGVERSRDDAGWIQRVENAVTGRCKT